MNYINLLELAENTFLSVNGNTWNEQGRFKTNHAVSLSPSRHCSIQAAVQLAAVHTVQPTTTCQM